MKNIIGFFLGLTLVLSAASTAHAEFNQAPDSGWPTVNGTVRVVLPANDGSVYIGGEFTMVGSSTRNRVARILANKTVDPNFNPNISGGDAYVHSLVLSPNGSTLYAGGSFTTVNGGTSRNNLAAFSILNGVATSFNPNIGGETVNALTFSSLGTLYVGGVFETVNGSTTRNGVAAFTPATTSTATNFNPNLGVGGYANNVLLSLNGATLYVGGTFTSVNGGTPRTHLAAFSTAGTGTATNFAPTIGNIGPVINSLALNASGTILYAGGDFASVNGFNRQDIIAFPVNSTGTITNLDIRSNDVVLNIGLSKDSQTLYAAGSFTHVQGGTAARNDLASFTVAGTGAITTFNPNVDGYLRDLAISSSGTKLYIGGGFNAIGGNSAFSNFAVFTALDIVAPVVTLLGPSEMTIRIEDSYVDPGVIAIDETDGDITANVVVSGSVNTSTLGTYLLTYTATDAALNSASTTRTVNVVPRCKKARKNCPPPPERPAAIESVGVVTKKNPSLR